MVSDSGHWRVAAGTAAATGQEQQDDGDLLEREREIAELAGLLTAARNGVTGVAVIEGAPGTGKSRLLAVAAALGAASGMRVLAARGLEIERDLAFGVAVSLLEPTIDGLSPQARARVFGGSAAVAAPLFGAGWTGAEADHPRLGRALARALRQLMRGLADGDGYQPVLLAIDDLRWCDLATLRFLTQLCGGPDPLPLAVTVAVRSQAPRPTGLALTATLRAAPSARSLRLRELSAGGTARLVRQSFPAADPAFAAACHAATGGNPYYLRELIGQAVKDGIAPDAGSVPLIAGLLPEQVAAAVLSRVASLGAAATAVAAAAAVLGDGTSLRHVALLADIGTEAAARAADALAAARVLRPGEPLAFDCPLARGAVYAELPPLGRSRMHRAAAALLDAGGAPSGEVAAHLLASGPDGDPRTVAVLRAAAAQAAERGQQAAARRLLLRALAEPPDRAAWPKVVQELAIADARTGAPEAVARVREALSVADPGQRVDLLRALARLLIVRSQYAAAARTAALALAELSGADGPAGPGTADGRVTEVTVEALAICGAAAVAPPPAAAALQAKIVAGAAAGTLPDDPACLAQLAMVLLASGTRPATMRAAARAALDRLPVDDGCYGMLAGPAAIALLIVDDYEPVRERVSAMLRYARAADALITEGMASHWLALLRYREGDLAGAVAAGQRTLSIADNGWNICIGLTAPVLAHAYLALGDTAAAARVLPSPDAFDVRRPDPWVIRAARAELTLDPPTALAELLDVGAHAERGGFAALLVEPWRPAAALAAAAAGQTARARSLATAEVELARAAGAPRRLGSALRVAGTVHDGEPALAFAAEAVTVLSQAPARLELARAQVELGAALRRAGQRTASRVPLHRGHELARDLGAAPLAERALHELRAAGGRRPRSRARSGPTALTPAEMSVASLAAAGQTTPRIAARLSVAPKTVDWHLGNAYRKLGITSRRQLAAALDATPDGATPPDDLPPDDPALRASCCYPTRPRLA